MRLVGAQPTSSTPQSGRHGVGTVVRAEAGAGDSQPNPTLRTDWAKELRAQLLVPHRIVCRVEYHVEWDIMSCDTMLWDITAFAPLVRSS
jgi:hypothetical protein